MKIKYNNKEYNKIKDLLADTTIANIDKFLFNNKKITLADFINLQEKEMGSELKDSYTIKEALIILKSKNAYAVEKFEKFIKG